MAMAYQPDEAVDVLRSIWSAQPPAGEKGGDEGTGEGTAPDGEDAALPFAEAKVCRNMKDVTFDGMAEPGTDLRAAWRERLRREGKLSTEGGSVRDLVLGPDQSR